MTFITPKRIRCYCLIVLAVSTYAAYAQKLPDSIDLRIQEIPEPEKENASLKEKLMNLSISKGIKRTKNSVGISLAIQQGKLAESQQEYLSAIHHYQKAIDLLVSQGDQQQVTDYLQHIGWLYQQAGRTQQALDQYEMVLERKEAAGDTTKLAELRRQIVELLPASPPDANVADNTALQEQQTSDTRQETARLKSLAESTEQGQDYKRSLEYYKLYTELNAKQKEAEQSQQLALQEKTFQLEKQAQQMKLLKSEKTVQALNLARQKEQLQEEQAFKRTLIIGTILVFIALIIIYIMYISKRKTLTGLNHAYRELNQTKDKLVHAEEELKNLLDQQLSRGVALQLMDQEKANQAQKKFVCIMFLDIRGFTPFAEKLKPEELIKYQNDVFGLMIDIVDKHHGVINQFLGDGFMATFGLQEDRHQVCDDALEAAIEIITVVNEKSKSGVIPATRVGIGLHAGNVVAGNVGTSIRKQYSVTGNTVITASRIEQLNKKFKSQLLISKEVYGHLSNPGKLNGDFINVEVKGRRQPVELLKIA